MTVATFYRDFFKKVFVVFVISKKVGRRYDNPYIHYIHPLFPLCPFTFIDNIHKTFCSWYLPCALMEKTTISVYLSFYDQLKAQVFLP